MKILITAFEPFGVHKLNPTINVINNLPAKISSHQIIKAILPVTYSDSFDRLKSEVKFHLPNVVICLGLAAERYIIAPELRAVNRINCNMPDNNGKLILNEKIDKMGEDFIDSNLPINKMMLNCIKHKIPIECSNDAGTFVCNYLFYKLLNNFKDSLQAGFIHIPMPLDLCQSTPSILNSEQITNGLKAMLEVL